MPRYYEPMKDAVAGETLRGDGKQSTIRRCPNGETHTLEERVSYMRGHILNGNRAK